MTNLVANITPPTPRPRQPKPLAERVMKTQIITAHFVSNIQLLCEVFEGGVATQFMQGLGCSRSNFTTWVKGAGKGIRKRYVQAIADKYNVPVSSLISRHLKSDEVTKLRDDMRAAKTASLPEFKLTGQPMPALPIAGTRAIDERNAQDQRIHEITLALVPALVSDNPYRDPALLAQYLKIAHEAAEIFVRGQKSGEAARVRAVG